MCIRDSNTTVRGTGNITVTNALNWVSGTIEGSVIPMPDLSIPASCTITTGASGNHTLSARRMDLAGTMIWTPTTAGFSLSNGAQVYNPVSYTHLRAHETPEHLVCRLLLEKK